MIPQKIVLILGAGAIHPTRAVVRVRGDSTSAYGQKKVAVEFEGEMLYSGRWEEDCNE